LTFVSSTGKGFQVPYPSITLHAVSRAEAGPSIYCQLDDQTTPPDGDAALQNGNGEDEEDFPMRELSIIPQDASSRTSAFCSSAVNSADIYAVEPIFEALSLCASLHPDPNGDDDDDMGDDNAFIDPDVAGFEPFDGTEGQLLPEYISAYHWAHLLRYLEQELSEAGKVRSDFVNDSRYAPY
jgi:chloride channel, nucleotide-sensitive, 1A